MTAPVQEAALDSVAIADAGASLTLPAVERSLSYANALRTARIGRLLTVWLPIWIVCAASMRSTSGALVGSLIFLVVWKVALRRAYADTSVTLWTIGAAVPAAVGALAGGLFVLSLTAWAPRFHLPVLAIVEATAGVFAGSALWETVVAGSLAARRRILLVGTGGGGSDLLEDISLAPRLPFEVVGVVDDERETDMVAGVPHLGTIAELPELIEQQRPQIVVLANDRCRGEAFDRLIEVGHLGFSVVGLPEFYEYAFGRLPVRSLNPQWFMSILDLYRRPYSQFAKRTFDVVVAALALLLVSPLLPVLALLVSRTRGPIIFRQQRLGEGGAVFTIYKFRTMRANAEPHGAVWAAEHDPRVTGVGRFMRQTRLDELPQLWNVLKGEMSIVGPRPERPEFAAELQAEVPFWLRRHLVKPGITGWAQVRRGYTADTAGTGDKLSYDLWYLRHRSLVVDVAILIKTFATLVSGAGAR